MTAPATHWIDAGGAKVFVQVSGSGDPVLLINGIGASHAMWEPLVAGLEGLEVIAFDAPGVGRTRGTLSPLGVTALARLVRDVLNALGRDRVDVVGYSFGGAVAQELARQVPGTVRRLVLAGATCGWGCVAGTPASLAMLAMPLRYYSRPFYLATAALLAGGQAERDPEFVRRAGEARLRFPPSVHGYLGQVAAMAGWSSWPWLHSLRQPTLVVQGDEDPVTPRANGILLAHRMPNARLRLQHREGHFLLLDPHSSAIPAIRDFLGATDLATSATWRDASQIDQEAYEEAIRGSSNSAQPFAAINALLRAAGPAPGDAS